MLDTRQETSSSEVRWEHMFPDELETAFDACPAVYFPYGLCSPNGPHATVGLPTINARNLLARTAQEHGGIVAPAESWHVHEIGGYGALAARRVGEARPWLTSVPPWVHFRNVCYHVRAAEALGFHAALLVSGHRGPHQNDLRAMIQWLQPHVRMRLLGITIEPQTRAILPSEDAHAGRDDTSLLAALAPNAVDLDRLPPAPNVPGFGAGSDAGEASREHGDNLTNDLVARLGTHLRRLLDAFDPDRPSNLQTFDDVERFWEQSMKPRLRALHCMRDNWAGQPPPSKASRWMANWHTKQQDTADERERARRATASVQDIGTWRGRRAHGHD